MINYTSDVGNKGQCSTLDQIAFPLKQLTVDWIAAGVMSLWKLVHRSFLGTGLSTNLYGADDHRIQLKTYAMMKMMMMMMMMQSFRASQQMISLQLQKITHGII